MGCKLCPDQKGAIVKVQTGDWYHITCVNYHRSVWFNEIEAPNASGVMETIKDTRSLGGKLRFDHYSLTCEICNKKQGACIQCDYRDCTAAFHVRCAIDAGIIREQTEALQRDNTDPYQMYLFCTKHQNKGRKWLKGADRKPKFCKRTLPRQVRQLDLSGSKYTVDDTEETYNDSSFRALL